MPPASCDYTIKKAVNNILYTFNTIIINSSSMPNPKGMSQTRNMIVVNESWPKLSILVVPVLKNPVK